MIGFPVLRSWTWLNSILARMDHELVATLAVREQHVFTDGRVGAVSICRRFLEMPLHLAGRQVEGDRRGGVEVVARAVSVSLRIAALITAIIVVGVRVAVPSRI